MYLSCIFILYCIIQTFGRPSHVIEEYDRDVKENAYGDSYEAGIDNYSGDRKMNQFSEKDTAVREVIKSNTDDDADHQQSDKQYFEDNDRIQADDSQRLSPNMLSSHNDISKRTSTYGAEETDTLFRKSGRSSKTDKKTHNGDAMDSREQIQYFKQYKTMRDDDNADVSEAKKYENIQENANRDKRQLQNLYSTKGSIGTVDESKQKDELDINEDEETAIKRHIKKLSKEELDELLNSLSEDKKALLRSIMDNSASQENDSVNKREITKKAGAIEENNFVGNELSDSSKIQGGSADIEESSISPNSEKLDNTKQMGAETVNSKTSKTISNSQKSSDKTNLSSDIEGLKLELPDKESIETPSTDIKLQIDARSGVQSSKNEKREINERNYIHFQDQQNNEDLYCYENENVPNLSKEESGLDGSKSIIKRDLFLSDSDLSESLKSLEESFPNIDDSTGCKSGNDMLPLVRVKRMKQPETVKKTDVSLTSNIKVPFFSNAVDNIEEDIDGGEFHDDGFFDRRASFAKIGELTKLRSDGLPNDIVNLQRNSGSQSIEIENTNLETETVNLGSDSDNVLSGVEGVDDNIMFNSGSRTRRTAHPIDEFHNSLHEEVDKDNLSYNKDPELQSAIALPKYSNIAPQYQENDAFGSLPRNYEEDLGRFKRIRRLKPFLAPKNNDSTLHK